MVPFDDTIPVFESPLTSSEIRNQLIALFNSDLSPLRPRASDPLGMTVYVNPSLIESFWNQVWHGITTPLSFAGDDSPIVSAPTVNPRIDLLTIDDEGTLVWTEGEENVTPVPPDCPEEVIPICYIYCKTTMTKICNFEDTATYPNDGYIYQDVRPFLNLGGSEPEWQPFDPTLKSEFYEDFWGAKTGGESGWDGVFSNSWYLSVGVITLIEGVNGKVRLAGTGASGGILYPYNQDTMKPYLATKNPILTIGLAQFGAVAGTKRFGFAVTSFGGVDRDGIYFRHATDGNVFAVCRSGGVETTLNTGVPGADGVYHSFKAVVDGVDVVTVYVDGVLKGTITEHIPSSSLFFNIDSGSFGATGGLYIDYVHIIQDR